MTEPSMIERVARAIEQCCVDLKDAAAGQYQSTLVARAAITAMREPTEAMIAAGKDTADFDCPPWRQDESIAQTHRAMIDAARSEKD